MNAAVASHVRRDVTLACRAGLAALVVFFSSATASAQVPGPRVPSSTDVVYVTGAFGVYRGTELVGAGSRQPYLGATFDGDLLLTSMITRRLGLDMGLFFGDAATKSGENDYFGRLDFALVTPLARRDGPRGYSVLVGVGAGVTVGRYWWADARVHPYAMARLTYLFSGSRSIFAEAVVAPIDTSLVAHTWAFENRFDVGAAIDFFFVGTRVGLTSIEGGDPPRTYGDLGVSFYLGFGARIAPARGGP